MNPLGSAWLLDKSGNCIEVYAHPSVSFEFESVVDVISKYGSEQDKANCEIWRTTKSDASKAAILDSYNQNWCKVRLWKDNKLTFRIASPDDDWYRTIVDFLTSKPHLSSADISVVDMSGKIYWDEVSYNYIVDPANKESFGSCSMDGAIQRGIDIDTFEKVIRAAKKRMVFCISANIYSFDVIKNEDERVRRISEFAGGLNAYNSYMTSELDIELATIRYNYFETFGEWINPETGVSTKVSSFIVLGPEYDEEPLLISNEKLLNGFREYAIELCGKYHQWAVLVIDCTEDVNDKHMNSIHMHDYRRDDTNAASLRGLFYDGNGNILKEYDDVSPKIFGEFLMALAKEQGAELYMLLASSNFYIPFKYTCLASWHRKHTIEDVYAQRQTDFYKRYAQSTLDLLTKLEE